MRRSGFVLAFSLAAFGAANAQRADSIRAGVGRHVSPALAPIASLIVPGIGQFLQNRDRAVVYGAVEGLGWWKLARDLGERTAQSNQFKSLARTVARGRLSPGGPDGTWTYYEALRDWLASGRYSQSDAELVPETATGTFNGYTWQVITATVDVDTPDGMAEALQLYAQRAAKPDMLWSWNNAQLQWDLFKRSTEKRNDADAAVKSDAAVLVLNHLLSMVDAFAMFRLDTQRMSDGRTAVGARIRW
jgi:hypothetical protein